MWAEIFAKVIIPVITCVAFVFADRFAKMFQSMWEARRKEPFRNQDLDYQISIILIRLRDKWNCLRVYYAEFHNGDHFIDGSEIMKYTWTHEATRPGISGERDHMDNVMITRVPEEIKLIREPGPSFRTAESLPSQCYFRWILTRTGVKAVARCKVVDARDKTIGFIGVDFDVEEAPADIDIICSVANDVSQLKAQYRK